MIIDLFSVPILIGNIDHKKIILQNKVFEKTWLSKTPSTFRQKGELNEKSKKYLMNTIVKILEKKIKFSFQIRLLNIWENKYGENDYQEPHIHTDSHFSFIIYQDVKEGKTVFTNPLKYLIQIFKFHFMLDEDFMPKCKSGQIIIFPSFLEHMVLKGSKGKTLSGNLNFEKLL